tara:strand:+ start:997 stop:1752 length:756 start_codon:yes stop_codon:yes gene_type:complete
MPMQFLLVFWLVGARRVTSDDKPEFASVMTAMCTAFGKELDEAILEAYWMALEDMPLDGFKQGAKKCLQEEEWMPKPGAIRRSAGVLSPDARAIFAFECVRKGIATHGAYVSVNFDDPLITATIRNMGGWPELCSLPAEKFNIFTRKDFEKIYKAMLESGVRGDAINHLPGKHEHTNLGRVAPVVQFIESGLPPAHKLLGAGSVSDSDRHLGEPGESEEPEEDSSHEGRAALHRLLKESFSMEEGGGETDS